MNALGIGAAIGRGIVKYDQFNRDRQRDELSTQAARLQIRSSMSDAEEKRKAMEWWPKYVSALTEANEIVAKENGSPEAVREAEGVLRSFAQQNPVPYAFQQNWDNMAKAPAAYAEQIQRGEQNIANTKILKHSASDPELKLGTKAKRTQINASAASAASANATAAQTTEKNQMMFAETAASRLYTNPDDLLKATTEDIESRLQTIKDEGLRDRARTVLYNRRATGVRTPAGAGGGGKSPTRADLLKDASIELGKQLAQIKDFNPNTIPDTSDMSYPEAMAAILAASKPSPEELRRAAQNVAGQEPFKSAGISWQDILAPAFHGGETKLEIPGDRATRATGGDGALVPPGDPFPDKTTQQVQSAMQKAAAKGDSVAVDRFRKVLEARRRFNANQ